MKTFNTLVVGAGLAGATVARYLADVGYKVNVIEKTDHVGGHCHDYQNHLGITIHTHGPHIFHTVDKSIWDFVNKYSEFTYYQHRVLSYADGKYIKFPINRDTLCSVFGVSLSTLEVGRFLEERVRQAVFQDPPVNFRDVIVSQVGDELYHLFFKNYTMKQWACNPEELSPEVAKRIPVRSNRDDRYFTDPYQGIPRYGYTNLVKNILDHPSITISLNTDYFSGDYSPAEYDLIVYTGELDRFFNNKRGKLEYRSLKLVFEEYGQEFYQPVATVNYPNDYDWTRITEFKHFLSESSPKTTVCFEYPAKEGDPYYIVMDEKNLAMRDSYMELVKELEQTGKYLFLGRLAEYKYYNMDQVIKQALERSGWWLSNHAKDLA